MKNHTPKLPLGVVLAIALAGCGGTESDVQSSPTTEPSAESQLSPEPPNEGEQAQDPPGEGEVQAMAKHCVVVCSVVNIGVGACPSNVSGNGSASFLIGGCNKACSKAREDAASKLPPYCMINSCSPSGC